MVFKFYEYDNLDIVPNKLKSAKLVKSIDIYAPQTITPLGCNITTKENISANIAEYTHQGVKYICYCTFTGMGNNMYNYRLDVDALATAWYANCFDRYNMVARSRLGTFKNDNALLRDTQRQMATYEFSDNDKSYKVLITIARPYATSADDPNYVLSGKGYDTYMLSPSQFYTFYDAIKKRTSTPTVADLAATIKNILILNTNLIDSFAFEEATDGLQLYGCSSNNYLASITLEESQFTGKLYRLKRTWRIDDSYKSFTYQLGTPFEINEDTCQGNLTFVTRYGSNFNIPISLIPKNISTITKVGYIIGIDYKTGDYILFPTVNGYTFYDLPSLGSISEKLPFLYDSTILTDTQAFGTNMSTITTILAGVVGVGVAIATGGAGAAITASIAAAATSSSAIARGVSATEQYNATGSTVKFSDGSSLFSTINMKSKFTFSWVPTVNKSSYQDRFGKADMTSRNITQLTGPVQTINCVASMNNLNQSIIQSATMQCDSGIWIL